MSREKPVGEQMNSLLHTLMMKGSPVAIPPYGLGGYSVMDRWTDF